MTALLEEISAAFTDLNKNFEEFKAANDERMSQFEKKGEVDVITANKVDKLNDAVAASQKTLDEVIKRVEGMKIGAQDNDNLQKSDHFNAFAEYFKTGDYSAYTNLQNAGASASTLGDPNGGFLAPIEFDKTIERVLAQQTALRELATVRPTSMKAYEKVVNLGGANSGWVGEKQIRTETNIPDLSLMQFPTMELYAMPAATQTLLEDSFVNVESWLADEVELVFAEQEGEKFITGDGDACPRGMLSYDKVINSSYAWGKLGFTSSGGAAGFAASNPMDKFLDLIYSLKKGYRANASFLMNDLTTAEIRKFKDDQGNYLWQPSAVKGEPAVFMGYDHHSDDFMPDVGANSYPIAFSDFRRSYLIVDRRGIKILRDPYSSKPYVLFYTTKRVGGGIQNFEAIKLMKIAA